MVSDRFAVATLLATSVSLLLPVLTLGLVAILAPLVQKVMLDYATGIAVYGAYGARTVASLGALYAFVAIISWLGLFLIRRPRPLGHTFIVIIGGFIGLWFVPAALITLSMTPEQQLTVGTLGGLGTLVLIQVGHRYVQPTVTAPQEAAD